MCIARACLHIPEPASGICKSLVFRMYQCIRVLPTAVDIHFAFCILHFGFRCVGTDFGEASYVDWVQKGRTLDSMYLKVPGSTEVVFGNQDTDCGGLVSWHRNHNELKPEERYSDIAPDKKNIKCTSDRDKDPDDLRAVCPADYEGGSNPKYIKYTMTWPAKDVYRRICQLKDDAHPKQSAYRDRLRDERIMLAKNVVYSNRGTRDHGMMTAVPCACACRGM